MDNHGFCRLMLAQVMPWVNKVTTPAVRKTTWAWHFNRDHHEWHGPKDPETGRQFYWHGSCCCKYMARYEGWSRWLEQYHPETYKAMEDADTKVADKLKSS